MSLPFYLEDPGPHWYGRVPWICLDLETTNKDKGDPRNEANRIVAMGSGDIVASDLAEPRHPQPSIVLVAHNAKFELGWLLRYGYDLSRILPFDTMIAEYVLAGNRQWDLSLDAIAKRRGLGGKDRATDTLMKAGICPSDMPERWVRERVASDVRLTIEIAKQQYKELRERGLLAVFFTRCIVTPVLTTIEATGMRLDAERVHKELRHQTAILKETTEVLDSMTGGINMRSRPQLAEFLYDKLGFEELTNRAGEPLRTATGLRMTDAESLQALKAKTPEQKRFLKLQASLASADARLSKALGVFELACLQQDGLLYGNFNQCVTQTHRLSSTAKRLTGPDGKDRGTQFQNLPREYKRLFCPHEPGRLITEYDYSQLEFRIAVELSGDRQGLRDVLSGHDVHRFTASVLRAKPMEEVTDEERQDAKADTFKPLYYGQSGTPRQRKYYQAFRERYPEIAAMQENWIATALRTKEQRTASGLIYYWPEAKADRSGYVSGSPSICNYPIQAFATADVVLVGLVHLHWRIEEAGLDAMIVNTVHDSVVVDHDADPTKVDALTRVAREALVDDVKRYVRTVYARELVVPLGVEFVTAPHWADKQDKVRSGKLGL